MLYRSANALAVFGLALGCFAGLAVVPSVRAGDKIEFSVPTAPLEVPKPVRPEKEITPDSISGPRPDDAVAEAQMQDSTEVVIIHPAKKEGRDVDPLAPNYRDGQASPSSQLDNFNDSLSSAKKTPGKLNPFSPHDDWELQQNGYYDKRKDEGVAKDSLHARLEAMDAADKTDSTKIDYGKGGFKGSFFSKDRSETTDETPWVQKYFKHELSVIGGTKDNFYDPYFDQMMKVNQAGQAPDGIVGGAFQDHFDSVEQSVRNATTPAALTEYQEQLDLARGKLQDPNQPVLRHYTPVDTISSYQQPNRYGPMMPPASPPGDVQSQPAILPFPKRPGSLFQ